MAGGSPEARTQFSSVVMLMNRRQGGSRARKEQQPCIEKDPSSCSFGPLLLPSLSFYARQALFFLKYFFFLCVDLWRCWASSSSVVPLPCARHICVVNIMAASSIKQDEDANTDELHEGGVIFNASSVLTKMQQDAFLVDPGFPFAPSAVAVYATQVYHVIVTVRV
jgi:hypothetical protein